MSNSYSRNLSSVYILNDYLGLVSRQAIIGEKVHYFKICLICFYTEYLFEVKI